MNRQLRRCRSTSPDNLDIPVGNIEELLRAADDTKWHVLYPREGVDGVKCDVLRSCEAPGASPFAVPPSAEVVVLVGELDNQAATRQALHSLNSQQPQCPVLVAIPRPSTQAPEKASVLAAQRAFCEAGADDVLLLPPLGAGAEEVQLAVELLIGRLQRHIAMMMRQHSEIHKLRKTNEEMVWPYVHRLINGFPKLQGLGTKTIEPGTRFWSHEVLSKLGEGAFGSVWLCKNHQSGHKEALKAMRKTDVKDLPGIFDLWNEVKLLRKLDHNNIAGFIAVGHSRHYMVLAQEFGGRRSLYRAQKAAGGRFALTDATSYGHQLAVALAHCHERLVAHRDVKPENVVLSDDGGVVKLCDFGSAIDLGTVKNGLCGTMPFLAPEALAGEAYEAGPADVWAFAVMLLEMICGIKRMDLLLGWTGGGAAAKVASSDVAALECSKELRAFFQDPDALAPCLRGSCGPNAPLEALAALLCGCFDLSAAERWTAERAASCELFAAKLLPPPRTRVLNGVISHNDATRE